MTRRDFHTNHIPMNHPNNIEGKLRIFASIGLNYWGKVKAEGLIEKNAPIHLVDENHEDLLL